MASYMRRDEKRNEPAMRFKRLTRGLYILEAHFCFFLLEELGNSVLRIVHQSFQPCQRFENLAGEL